MVLIQIKIAQGLARIWSFFGFAQRLGKFLFQEIVFVLFRVDGLAEEAFLAFVLLAHSARGCFKILKGTFARRWRVGDYSARCRINLEHGSAIGAGYFKRSLFLRRHINM